jgi:hypothetical protein
MSLAQRRRSVHRSSNFMERPHASQLERDTTGDDKQLDGTEGPHAALRQSTLQSEDEER